MALALTAVALVALSLRATVLQPKHVLSGTVLIDAPDPGSEEATDLPESVRAGWPCDGGSVGAAYADVTAGRDVVVRNDQDAAVATGSLAHGRWRQASSGPACAMSFRVPDVPASGRYTIEIGDRGRLSFSRHELEERDWEVTLTLGR